jgi:hypothetical protein
MLVVLSTVVMFALNREGKHIGGVKQKKKMLDLVLLPGLHPSFIILPVNLTVR